MLKLIMYTITYMTKIKKIGKLEGHYFEKISFSFFAFAYIFMVSSIVFHIATFKKFNPSKTLNVNVIESENTTPDITSVSEIIANIYAQQKYTKYSFIDQEFKQKILTLVKKDRVNSYNLLIDSSGNVNLDTLNIVIGDIVIFTNTGNYPVTLSGVQGDEVTIESGGFYTRDFYINSDYEYTIKPFATKGKILVGIE